MCEKCGSLNQWKYFKKVQSWLCEVCAREWDKYFVDRFGINATIYQQECYVRLWREAWLDFMNIIKVIFS